MNHNINDQQESVYDTKVDESIKIWKNKNLSKALRTWRENEQISDVKTDITPVINKTEVNQSSCEYTNSHDDYDSDTERELYRYRINPNSLYTD